MFTVYCRLKITFFSPFSSSSKNLLRTFNKLKSNISKKNFWNWGPITIWHNV